MKKQGWIVFVVTLVLGFFLVTANAEEFDREALKAEIKKELKEEMRGEGGVLSGIQDRIKFSGLIEFGGAWQNLNYTDGTDDLNQSDLTLTTVELTGEAEVNDWVNVAITFLYEDGTSFEGEPGQTASTEGNVNVDEGILTIGNTEKYPLYFSAGAMYLPFGALLTHFPDNPLINLPLPLILGEIREKAALVGVEHQGFSLCGYIFNGDMDETGQEDQIESYGFDANYSFDDEKGLEILIGASYLSNIADSNTLEEHLTTVKDYVGGFDCYLHVGYAPFFFDAEYMTATDEFDSTDGITTGAANTPAQPAVWNFELGYNLDWGKNLEIALKYAGSDESERQLGFPETRYGITLNQELFEAVIASLAYLHDDYETNDIHNRDDRDVVFAQIAIEF